MTNKKVIIAGATGLVGKTLFHTLRKKGYTIGIVTRDVAEAKHILPDASHYIAWSDRKGLEDAIDGAYGVINLSGAPIVGKRWTEAYKKIILTSRTASTKQIVDSIEKAKTKPKVLINGSAVGYYGTVETADAFTETDKAGSDFLAQVCVAWELEAKLAEQFGTRWVSIRTSIILDKKEGALPQMLKPFFLGVGGPIGSGRQAFPWIHVRDEVGIICFALENEKVKGPINAVSPEILTNKAFATTLGQVLHKPSFVHLPPFILKLAFGEAAVVITTGTKISAQKIIDGGYKFVYPHLQPALENILQ